MSYREREYLYNERNGGTIQSRPGGADAETINQKGRSQKPVKLQPSWEENNLPESELNFKNLTMDEASLQIHTPPDRFNCVYIIFLIHGIATLLPWNMFINASDYFIHFKLGEKTLGYQYPGNEKFMQTLTFFSQVPNVIFNWFNIFVPLKGDLTLRIMWSLAVNILIFIITIIFAMVDSTNWPDAFYWTTMLKVVIVNVANGVYQNTVYGMAAKLPPKYTGAIILGNNICGTFTTVVCIISHYVAPSDKMAAIWYFITALLVLLIGFDTYFALPLNRFYRHFDIREKKQQEKRVAEPGASQRPPFLKIVMQAWPQLLNVFLIFFVTLAIYPTVNIGIKASSESFFIKDEFLYLQILCFLTFNVFAMVGSIVSGFVTWPSKKYLWIPVTLRLLYIPFYLFCNYEPLLPSGQVRVLPVYINNDWAYWIVGSTMAFTSGYFSSLAMMYTPSMVESQYATVAGMFAGAALITGIFSGILMSFLWPWFVSHVGW